MSFKLPCLTMKANIPRVSGLPLFKYEDLKEIAVVGQGSFGVVCCLIMKRRMPLL